MSVKLKLSGVALAIALIPLAPLAARSTTTTTTTTLPGSKVAICHQSLAEGGRKIKTIRVSRSALRAHLEHGDTLGVCP